MTVTRAHTHTHTAQHMPKNPKASIDVVPEEARVESRRTQTAAGDSAFKPSPSPSCTNFSSVLKSWREQGFLGRYQGKCSRSQPASPTQGVLSPLFEVSFLLFPPQQFLSIFFPIAIDLVRVARSRSPLHCGTSVNVFALCSTSCPL